MAEVQTIKRVWNGPVIVVANGPSLTDDVAWKCRKARWFGPYKIVCVNDSYRKLLNADVLYSCDKEWWDVHEGAKEFRGERWSSHDDDKGTSNDKRSCADRWGLNIVYGRPRSGFSLDPSCIHYGHSSGFQAVNLAILMGATKIVLVAFDMREVNGQRHFFGNHPPPLRNHGNYENFIRAFVEAKSPVPIVNATPGSALKCYPIMPLEEALVEVAEGSPISYPGIDECAYK